MLRRTGQAGPPLRDEALAYIATTLAHDDWDDDGRPDHDQGGPHPLERLEDGSLWPRDRSWSAAVYRRVGDVLFEDAHLDEAILAWRLRLAVSLGGFAERLRWAASLGGSAGRLRWDLKSPASEVAVPRAVRAGHDERPQHGNKVSPVRVFLFAIRETQV